MGYLPKYLPSLLERFHTLCQSWCCHCYPDRNFQTSSFEMSAGASCSHCSTSSCSVQGQKLLEVPLKDLILVKWMQTRNWKGGLNPVYRLSCITVGEHLGYSSSEPNELRDNLLAHCQMPHFWWYIRKELSLPSAWGQCEIWQGKGMLTQEQY